MKSLFESVFLTLIPGTLVLTIGLLYSFAWEVLIKPFLIKHGMLPHVTIALLIVGYYLCFWLLYVYPKKNKTR